MQRIRRKNRQTVSVRWKQIDVVGEGKAVQRTAARCCVKRPLGGEDDRSSGHATVEDWSGYESRSDEQFSSQLYGIPYSHRPSARAFMNYQHNILRSGNGSLEWSEGSGSRSETPSTVGRQTALSLACHGKSANREQDC